MRNRRILFAWAAACTLLLQLFGAGEHSAAQSIGVRWKPPVNISNSFTSSTYPVAVTDRYGSIYVFWGEDNGGDAVNVAQPVEKSNSILFSEWNGTTWSEPVDLFYSTAGGGINFPYVVLDQNETLHLVWQAYDGIYYSSAPAQQASSVKAWRPAQLLVRARANGPYLQVDSEGKLYMVYPAWEDAATGTKDGNIYFMSSSDSGASWTEPVLLSNIPEQAAMQASHPTLVVDAQKNLHVVWYQAESPDWVGSAVYYTRSEDGGFSWLAPIEMARRQGDKGWSSQPELAILAGSELHLVWVCGETPHRCHRWSKDAGRTWSATEQEFGDMVSLAGWDSLVTDGDGTLYWILQLRYPESLWYSFWMGNSWSDIQPINSDILATGHYPRVVSRLGNLLDMVVVDQDRKEVWYIQGQTSAMGIPPAPTPTPAPAATPEPTETPAAAGSPLHLASLPSDSLRSAPAVNPNSQSSFILFAILPVIGLMGGVAVIKLVLFRRD